MRYAVTLRERHGGLVRLTTRAHALRLKAAHPTFAGVVSVQALSADGSLGAVRRVRYRAERAAVNRFLRFSQLRVKPRPKPRHKRR